MVLSALGILRNLGLPWQVYIWGFIKMTPPIFGPNVFEYEDPTNKKCYSEYTPVILGIGLLDSSCLDICSTSLAPNYPFLLLGVSKKIILNFFIQLATISDTLLGVPYSFVVSTKFIPVPLCIIDIYNG